MRCCVMCKACTHAGTSACTRVRVHARISTRRHRHVSYASRHARRHAGTRVQARVHAGHWRAGMRVSKHAIVRARVHAGKCAHACSGARECTRAQCARAPARGSPINNPQSTIHRRGRPPTAGAPSQRPDRAPNQRGGGPPAATALDTACTVLQPINAFREHKAAPRVSGGHPPESERSEWDEM